MSTFRDREILTAAESQGLAATLLAYMRLSGPGWLQGAITLGGGSLIGSLYLGMLGGTELLWLQLFAIVIGVVMLAAISYVSLSTRQRPYAAINEHINPVLGVGWLTATVLANMIWILPQFSLCYDALDNNLVSGGLGKNVATQAWVSAGIAVLAITIVLMSFNPGWMSRVFGAMLKLVIAAVLVCFVWVALHLMSSGELSWNDVLLGFVPDFSLWNHPSTRIRSLIEGADIPQQYWSDLVVGRQRENMISAAATAVGINMTFLLPYSMLARGWDKPFRGLARFDLSVGLIIPFLLVTTSIVIASAHAFHGKADEALLSEDPGTVQQSVLFKSLLPVLEGRYMHEAASNSPLEILNREILDWTAKNKETELQNDGSKQLAQGLVAAQQAKNNELAKFTAGLDPTERKLAASLVKPNLAQLSATLEPVLGARQAAWLLGLGALGMGFSTIVILMYTNSLAFAEMSGRFESFYPKAIGAVVAAIIGFLWFIIWTHESRTYLVITASTFGAILLPIAYVTFFVLMNSTRVLGAERPSGVARMVWNTLMLIAVAGAILQAYGGVASNFQKPLGGPILIGGMVTFFLLALVGFSAKQGTGESQADPTGKPVSRG